MNLDADPVISDLTTNKKLKSKQDLTVIKISSNNILLPLELIIFQYDMKNYVKRSIYFSLISILFFMFTSCAKEDLVEDSMYNTYLAELTQSFAKQIVKDEKDEVESKKLIEKAIRDMLADNNLENSQPIQVLEFSKNTYSFIIELSLEEYDVLRKDSRIEYIAEN